eukprot:403354171
MESSQKVTRSKLVENSRQKFYENLGQHYKENKDALPVGDKNSKSQQKTQSRTGTATSATRTTKPNNDAIQNTATASKKPIPRPQSGVRAKTNQTSKPPAFNKDLSISQQSSVNDINAKGNTTAQNLKNLKNQINNGQKTVQSTQNKTAPSFTTKMPYTLQNNDPNGMSGLLNAAAGVMSHDQISNMSKRTLGFRDQLIEQIKENIHNPKILKELQQKNTHIKVDFNQLIHQAKLLIVKENKQKSKTSTVEDEISKRIENSRKLLLRLKQIKSTPPLYSNSILQSAIFNKSRIIEAHLSTMADDQKKVQINQLDEDHSRSAIFYSAFYGSVESIELLAATPLHYAAINDNSKVIECIFMAFKQQGEVMKVHGQLDEKDNGGGLTKNIPKATFSPFKGLHDKMDEENKKKEELKRLQKQWEEEEGKDPNDDEGFELDNEDDNGFKESFKVQVEGGDNGNTGGAAGMGKMFTGMASFFTQKAILDVQDEKQSTMYEEMNKIDKLYIPQSELIKSAKKVKINQEEEKKEEFVGVPQVSLNGIINFRDLKGRTALHVAVAFNNKNAVETQLFLNANPLIEDIYGQRPIEFALDDAIRDLIQNKMQRAQAPSYSSIPKMKNKKIETIGGAINSLLNVQPTRKMSGMSMNSQNFTKKSKNDQVGVASQYPLEVKDLKVVLKEKIIISKIGIENDNWLQYAIKNKSFEACLFLLQEVQSGEWDFSYKNSVGNTVLHLAIRTGSCRFVKMLFVQDIQNANKYLENDKPDDIFGLINDQSLKLLGIQNNKGMTPLQAAVDQGSFEIFRFMLEIYYYNDQISKANLKLLPKVINMKDDKGDTCLLKAVKAKSLEMVYSLLQLGNDIITYDVLLEKDLTQKNIMHYAAINQQKELLNILAKLDSDRMELRMGGDAKKKTPQQYDQSSSLTECFSTVWDYAKEGNLRKLKFILDTGKFQANDQTPWNKNTALHIAVRGQQLEIIKSLIYDYNADITIENALGKTVSILAQQIKDEALQQTILGLLNKLHSSTKVPRGLDAKREKLKERKEQTEEVNRLRRQLNQSIQERGLDIAKMFQMFDKNGDGVFSPLEFECAFLALDIDVTKADLRRFISLTDTNKDGKVDFNEFYNMLNKQETKEEDTGMNNSDVDFNTSFEEVQDDQ